MTSGKAVAEKKTVGLSMAWRELSFKHLPPHVPLSSHILGAQSNDDHQPSPD